MQNKSENQNDVLDELDKTQEVKISQEESKNIEKTQVVDIPKAMQSDSTFEQEQNNEAQSNNNESISNNENKKEINKIEKQKDNYSKKKKRIKVAVISGSFLILVLFFSLIFALINLGNDKIITGVSINGIEVSGLSKEEAKGKLETIIAEKKKQDITVKYQDFETGINSELIETKYDVQKAVDNAYNIGRNGNIFANNYNILFTMIGKKNVDLDVSLNEEQLKTTLKDISSKLPNAIKEASFYIENDELIITRGKKGNAVDVEDTKSKLMTYLKDINKKDFLIDLKVYGKEPDEINIDEIYKEVHTEAKDAYYTKDPFQIYPEVNGIDFNVDEAKELIKEVKDEYTIKLNISKPNVTVDQIGTEAFPDRLSIFTTRYDASNYNRTTNLRLASNKINGKVLMPGEVFSYNKVVGERTISAGYKEAAIYAGGRVVDGLGGGICQISSTLYNAALLANLEITDRSNHSFVTSYVGAGRDATVVYGVIDFQFKNSRKYPIRIVSSVQSGVATMEIYGIKEEEEYDISFDTRTIATIPTSTEYVEDSSLGEGEEVVEQRGHNGVQTETYITKSLNGKVVSRNLLSKDTYNAMKKIVRRGPAVAQPTSQPEPKPEPQQEQKQSTEPANPEPTPEPNPVDTKPSEPVSVEPTPVETENSTPTESTNP